MLQLIGVLIIVNSLAIAGWWLSQQKPGMTWCVSLCLIAIFAGIVLIFNERAVEITIEKVGTIKAVAEQAKVDAKTISDIRERIEGQAATVDAVAKQAADAKRISEEVQKKNQQADEKLKTIDEALKRGNEAIAELQSYTTFNNTVLAAQNDDRRAFDQLNAWAEDKNYPFMTEAKQTWINILDSHNSPMMMGGFNIPWSEGIDPTKLSLEQLKVDYKEGPRQLRVAMIEYIWTKRIDIPKRDRMQFLVDVLRNDSSLRVVEYAGLYFTGASQDKLKRLAIKQHIEWWEKNKESIKD
jgi:hypothetical protein